LLDIFASFLHSLRQQHKARKWRVGAISREARTISRTEFDRLFEEVKNWGRWGAEDQRGTLNLISPAKALAASKLVAEGITVSAGRHLATEAGPYNPVPVAHHMIRAGDLANREGYGGSLDYFAMAPHGRMDTHLDALCHIFYRAEMYNGFPAAKVTSAGATVNSIETSKDGIVSRGVLLDIPQVRGLPFLEPGDAIYQEDLEAAEAAEGLKVEEGDILLIYTGRWPRVEEKGGWNPGEGLAGLHATCMPWLRERGIALLGCDGISDVIPSGLEGSGLNGRPVHILAIPAMGLGLIDNCDLEELASACSERNRWAFCLAIAPLKLRRGTASPLNPIAVF
jgi:kynurenine formamidase